MTLPASGAISFNAINVELCRAGGAQLSLNDSAVRTLFGQASGAVCMNTGHGKSNTSVPGAPTSVSASATSCSAISVSFSAPASNGGLTIDYYQVVCTSSGSNSATGASSPISVTGLSASTSYTFKVRAHNSKGYGCYSGTASATTQSPPYMCITTSGATVITCGNYKIARWTGSGSFTVNSLGSSSGYGNHINYLTVAGGGGGPKNIACGGGGGGGVLENSSCLSTGGVAVSAQSYSVCVGAGGTTAGASTSAGRGTASSIAGIISSSGGGGGARSGGACYKDGGSGGGQCGTFSNDSGTGISGQGFRGGYFASYCCDGLGAAAILAGGGGGAGAVGGNAVLYSPYRGGNGGSGRFSNILGITVGGGGGGGTYTVGISQASVGIGSGGSGGGGSGGKNAVNNTAGAAGLGGGGGGGTCTYPYTGPSNGTGGSGTVAIKWRFQ